MNTKSPIFKFFLLIVIIVAVFLAYRFFFVSSPSSNAGLVSLSPAGTSGDMSGTASDQFVVLLSNLRAINLNDLPRVVGLLNGLEDFSTALEPQTPGRSNPFLPIGRGGGLTVSATTSLATTTASTTGSH